MKAVRGQKRHEGVDLMKKVFNKSGIPSNLDKFLTLCDTCLPLHS